MLGAAFDQARRLDHGWTGTEHLLLARLAQPSVATEALADAGVTYPRVLEALQGPDGLLGPDVQRYSPERGPDGEPQGAQGLRPGRWARARMGPPFAFARALGVGDRL